MKLVVFTLLLVQVELCFVLAQDYTTDSTPSPSSPEKPSKKSQTKQPQQPNCTESWESFFKNEGDTNKRLVINCENLDITERNLENYLRRVSPLVNVLNLAYNKLDSINISLLTRFVHLEVLNVSDNRIKEMTGDDTKWPPRLTLVDYSWNRLTNLNAKMIPQNAKRLLLTENLIQYIKTDTFGPGIGDKLIVLDLSRNRMKSIFHTESGVMITPRLRFLNLSHNALSGFFKNERKPMIAFSRLESLEVLDLSHNEIERILAGDLQYLGSLKHLDLSYNDLPDLDAFSLNSLMLKRNGHPYIWQHWAYRWWLLPGPGLKNLESVDLSYNHIQQIDLPLIHEMGKLETVDLSGNWFHCDGELYFAVSMMKPHVFVNSTFVNINDPDKYTCYSPPAQAGEHIYSFNCSGECFQTYSELKRRFEMSNGSPPPEEPEDLTGPSIAMVAGATIFLAVVLLAFLWALRNGLIHRFCHVCLTRLSTSPHRNSRSGQNSMTARFAQLDQLEAETEVA